MVYAPTYLMERPRLVAVAGPLQQVLATVLELVSGEQAPQWLWWVQLHHHLPDPALVEQAAVLSKQGFMCSEVVKGTLQEFDDLFHQYYRGLSCPRSPHP